MFNIDSKIISNAAHAIRILAPLAPSPTKASSIDLLLKETAHLSNSTLQPAQVTIRKSPKKRPLKRYTIVSSSSSTESLTSDTKGKQIQIYTHKVSLICASYVLSISATEIGHTQNFLKHLCYLLYLARFGLYLKGKSLKHTENDFEKVFLLMLFLCCRKKKKKSNRY